MLLGRLREWRESRGFTQKELALEASVGEITVVRIEAGTSVRPNTARKIADALGVAVVDLQEKPPVPLGPAPTSPVPAEDEERRASVEAETGPMSFEEGEDVLLLEEAVGAEHPSLEEFSVNLLVSTLARFIAVRRRLRDSESEELKRGGGDLTDRLIIAVAEELDERLIGGLGEKELVERLSERDYEALAELYRLSEPRKESMPRLHAVAERSLARSGARVGVGGAWEEEPLSAMQRERNAAPRTPNEASEAEAG